MITSQIKRFHRLSALIPVLLICVMTGCESDAQSGALLGAGVGALIGQAAGGDTGATLIGAGVGAGAGYMIGNEKDKKEAEKKTANDNYSTAESPLAGTNWQVVSVTPEPDPPFTSMTFTFGRDGYVHSTKVFADGKLVKASERYRTVGKTLIVNKPGYIINAEYAIDGSQLIISCDRFSGVATRIGS